MTGVADQSADQFCRVIAENMFDAINLLTSGRLCLAAGVAAAVAVTLRVTAWPSSIAAEEAETDDKVSPA